MTDVAKKKVTAGDIRGALRQRWGGGVESTIVFEVAQGTGFSAKRHLDAVAMELWPSRGLALHGIEIKVSLNDYRKEANDPTKAEEIARFCDYFWIAAPAGLIPLIELPSAWGLLEYGDDGRLSIKKAAEKTAAVDVTRLFMAAMLRASSRPMDAKDIDEVFKSRSDALERTFKQRVSEEAKLELGRVNVAAELWRKLEETLKDKPEDYVYEPDVIAAVRFVVKTNFVHSYGSVRQLHDSMVDMVAKMGPLMDALQVPQQTEIQKLSETISNFGRRK